MAGHAETLGFTDVTTYGPRPGGPCAGSVAVLAEVTATVVAVDLITDG